MDGTYGSWKQWLKSKLTGKQGGSCRRLRNRQMTAMTPIAAQVEQLETRALLAFTYNGGALITNVQAQNVFMGSDWKNNIGGIQTLEGKLDSFVTASVNGSLLDGLTVAGFRVYRGTSSPGVTDNVVINKDFTLVSNFFVATGGFDDLQIRAELQKMITTGQVQAPNANRLYNVFVEPGVVVTEQGANSIFFFGGYHGAFHGQTAGGAPVDIRYSVQPFPGTPNRSHTTQPLPYTLNGLTTVLSHEMAESVTDPNVTFANDTGQLSFVGWYDLTNNGEVADLSQQFTTIKDGFVVQMPENPGNGLINPNAQLHTLAAPTNLAISAITATKGQLSWTGSPLAQGYNIFSVNGTTVTKIGTAGPGATTFTLNGVVPGSHVSYIVQAFDGPTTANSSVFTGFSTFASLSTGSPAGNQSTTNQSTLPVFVGGPAVTTSALPAPSTPTPSTTQFRHLRNYYSL